LFAELDEVHLGCRNKRGDKEGKAKGLGDHGGEFEKCGGPSRGRSF
jgi:hypothetical protein